MKLPCLSTFGPTPTLLATLLLFVFSSDTNIGYNVAHGQSENDCFGRLITTEKITKLDIFHSEVTNNTLHLDGGELRYSNIGTVRDKAVDLVVTVESGDYTDIAESPVWRRRGVLNGKNGAFGNINLQTVAGKPLSGRGDFKFCFRDAETDELTKVDAFSFTGFDWDNRMKDTGINGIGIKEKMMIDTSQVTLYQLWPNEQESHINLYCEDGSSPPCDEGIRTVFQASIDGILEDNPNNPANMTYLQKRRSVVFTFQDTDCWTLTYDHYCPVEQDSDIHPLGYNPDFDNQKSGRCRGYTGGNFLFSGDADEIISDGECILPDRTRQPTTAPTTPEPTRSAIQSRTVVTPPHKEICEGKEEVLTKLDFYDANILENSLHWPNQTGRLRYEDVGLLRGQSIDLVVTQNKDAPPYSTDMPWRNGYNLGDDLDNPDYTWNKFGNINVMTKDPRDASLSDEDKALMNGEGTFDFCFYYTGTEELATVDSFDWSVYDLDLRQSGGLNEKFIIDTAQAKYFFVQSESEVKMWCENEGPDTAIKAGTFQYVASEGVPGKEEQSTNIQGYKPITCDPGVKTIFHSTTKGGLEDNPTDPETLTKQQKARSIEFRFENTSCWTFKYEHYCPCGNYCDQPGGGPAEFCKGKGDGDPNQKDGKRWCPLSSNDQDTYDPNFPNACKRYTSGNFLFAGSSDEKLSEEGECVTPPPTPAPEPAKDCYGEIITINETTKLDLYNSEITNNTLHLDGGELRYSNIGIVRDKPVDLVVTVDYGLYTDIEQVWEDRNKIPDEQNGKNGEFGKLNLQTVKTKPTSGQGNFKFCFHDTESNILTKVNTFRWTVFDFDERGDDKAKDGIGNKEKMLMDTSQARLYQLWPNEQDSEIKLSCEDGSPVPCSSGIRTVFHSSTAGTGSDNPNDPANMTNLQKSRSVTFTFQDIDCWTFTYDHYCPVEQDYDVIFPLAYDPADNDWKKPENHNNKWNTNECRGYDGGNFLFSGDADEIIEEGECITPPPTTAPPTDEPTAEPTNNPTVKPTASPTATPTKNPTLLPTPSPTKTPTATPTAGPTKIPTASPTASPTKDPTVSPTVPPTVSPTKSPTSAPTVSPTKSPTTSPTKSPTKNPTVSPTASPTLPPLQCLEDGVIVKRIDGVTAFPTTPTKPVAIVHVGSDEDGHSTVTVVSNQFWNVSSSVDHVFASYKETLYNEVCIEDQDVAGGGMIFDHTITIQCNIMSPWAYLKICVVDDLANNVLTNEDNAEIPKCCFPEIPDEHGKVCYNLEISCSLECVQVVEEKRRMLRAGN